jgi:hypothetical protein
MSDGPDLPMTSESVLAGQTRDTEGVTVRNNQGGVQG